MRVLMLLTIVAALFAGGVASAQVLNPADPEFAYPYPGYYNDGYHYNWHHTYGYGREPYYARFAPYDPPYYPNYTPYTPAYRGYRYVNPESNINAAITGMIHY